MRRILFAATIGMFTLLATPAWASPIAVAIHVSPSSVPAGQPVTLSGSVGPDCPGPVTISKAFVHTHDFAGLPAVFATVKQGGAFTTTTRIPRSKAAGTYTITGRCGGGNLGVSATLRVRAPSPIPGLPRTGSTTAPFLFAGLGLRAGRAGPRRGQTWPTHRLAVRC
jgi:hypothetical protein